MQNSLRQIRHSASKKKQEMSRHVHDRSPSPPGDDSSGYYRYNTRTKGDLWQASMQPILPFHDLADPQGERRVSVRRGVHWRPDPFSGRSSWSHFWALLAKLSLSGACQYLSEVGKDWSCHCSWGVSKSLWAIAKSHSLHGDFYPFLNWVTKASMLSISVCSKRSDSIDGRTRMNNQYLDFQPNGGVTFRPNKTSDVQVRRFSFSPWPLVRDVIIKNPRQSCTSTKSCFSLCMRRRVVHQRSCWSREAFRFKAHRWANDSKSFCAWILFCKTHQP